jgi:hypothetical protein
MVEAKYGTAGQATNQNIILRMRFSCWINTLKMEPLQPRRKIVSVSAIPSFNIRLLSSPAMRSNARMTRQTKRRWLRR